MSECERSSDRQLRLTLWTAAHLVLLRFPLLARSFSQPSMWHLKHLEVSEAVSAHLTPPHSGLSRLPCRDTPSLSHVPSSCQEILQPLSLTLILKPEHVAKLPRSPAEAVARPSLPNASPAVFSASSIAQAWLSWNLLWRPRLALNSELHLLPPQCWD